MKIFTFFSIAFLLLMAATPSWSWSASPRVGAIVAIRGEARAIDSDGGERPLAMKSPVYLRDTLRTGERGRLQVLFNDETLISIGPASRMVVADYEWDGAAGKMENRVKEGFFHIMGGNIAKQSPENFNTKTPIATIGIRGSIYALSMVDNQLSVVFIGGTGIHVFNNAGRVEIDRPGYGIRLMQPEKKPPAPRKFTEKEFGGILRPVKPDKKKGPPVSKKEKMPPSADPVGQPGHIETVDKEVDDSRQIIQNRETVADLSGAYMTMLADPDLPFEVITSVDKGSLSGVTREGHVFARGESAAGRAFTFEFNMPRLNSSAPYHGPAKGEVMMAPFPVGNEDVGDAMLAVDRYDAPLGEFAILSVPGESIVSNMETLRYTMLGFLGRPAIQQFRPRDVIHGFFGPAMGTTRIFRDDFTEGGTGDLSMRVNWRNNRFIGFIDDETDGKDDMVRTAFFGSVDPDRPVMDQAVFIGNFGHLPGDGMAAPPNDGNPGDPPPDFFPITWITGSDTGFGRFYGTAYQGFGGLAQGGFVEIETDQTAMSGEWRIAAGAFRYPEVDKAPQGTMVLEGFVTGVSENMTAPDVNPRFYMNSRSSGFRMVLDRDAGIITGSMSAHDFADSAHAIEDLEIGGVWGSAYVDDNLYISLLGGTDVIVSSGKTGGLKPYGNHLEPTEPGARLAAHTQWGYWEAAYDDPDTGAPFHVHVPGSMWVAGRVTPGEKINDLIQRSHIGHYEGRSLGVLTGPGQPDLTAMNGTVNLNIDFSPSSPAPVTGHINFKDQGIDLVIENGTVAASGFSADFRETIRSELNGGFFGPDAESVAGNFAAILEQERAITGIFGADAVNP